MVAETRLMARFCPEADLQQQQAGRSDGWQHEAAPCAELLEAEVTSRHETTQQARSLALLVARINIVGGICPEADLQQLQSTLDETSAKADSLGQNTQAMKANIGLLCLWQQT